MQDIIIDIPVIGYKTFKLSYHNFDDENQVEKDLKRIGTMFPYGSEHKHVDKI